MNTPETPREPQHVEHPEPRGDDQRGDDQRDDEVIRPDERHAAGTVADAEILGGDALAAAAGGTDASAADPVTEPAKVMRIGSMVKQLLEEVRHAPLDEASRERLAEIYERSIVELSSALSPDLQEELHLLALPFRDDTTPSEAELRVAKAQLVGWLEGLFHGIQATLFAQQVVARQQLAQMRQLPPGVPDGQIPAEGDRPGTYL